MTFFITGTGTEMRKLLEELESGFDVESVSLGGIFFSNGFEVESKLHSKSSISLSMRDYINSLHTLDISRARARHVAERATEVERTDYRVLAGTFIYLGTSIVPHSSFETSIMHRKLGVLLVLILLDTKNFLEGILRMAPVKHDYVRKKWLRKRWKRSLTRRRAALIHYMDKRRVFRD